MTASATEQTAAPVAEQRARIDRQTVALPEVDEDLRWAGSGNPPSCRAADALLPELAKMGLHGSREDGSLLRAHHPLRW
jgi:hypothetical protein